MTWTKLDDAAPQHPKAKAAGNDAWSLWVAAIVYSNRYLTDGVVSVGVLATECLPQPISLAKAKKLAEQLCDVKQRPDGHGLFERIDRQFYRIHDFTAYNPSKAEVEARREYDRNRKKGGGGPSGAPPGAPPGLPNGNGGDSGRNPSGVLTHAGARSPVPSRPVPAIPDPPSPDGLVGETLQERARLWLEDPNRATFTHPRPETWPEVLSLGERLAGVFGVAIEKPRQPRDPRCWVPLQRYAEGYSEAELLDAIEGAKQSKAIGENREYQVLATILRDGAQVDKLRALHRPSGSVRKVPSIAERIAADEALAAKRRVELGLPPLTRPEDAVTDPAELERLTRGIGGMG